MDFPFISISDIYDTGIYPPKSVYNFVGLYRRDDTNVIKDDICLILKISQYKVREF